MPTSLSGARVITPGGVLDPGWIRLRGSMIGDVGAGRVDDGVTLDGHWVLPGFVDLHMHGGGGHDVATSTAELRGAVDFHRSRGTTSTLVSFVAAPVDRLCTQLSWVAGRPAGGVLGSHLEGPFLAESRRGAQNPDHLREPDLGVVRELLGAAGGTLRVMTVAPELPGALDAIELLLESGVIPAIGHTDATYEQASAAVARGARLATHLFNGMRPIHHREPGPVLAALDAGLAAEMIHDGVHLHPAIVRMVAAHPAARLVLVTDAIAAAGVPDGDFELGGQRVVVRGGVARLAGSDALAGSTLTMDVAVRRTVLDAGLPMQQASAAASATPAAVIGAAGSVGAIAPGRSADLVVLDDELRLVAVLVAGAVVAGELPGRR